MSKFHLYPSILSLFTFSLFIFPSTSSFTPIDNYLINCGSSSPSTIDLDNRSFNGDESFRSNSVSISATRTISITYPISNGYLSKLHNSARIFTKSSLYTFKMKQKGAHFIRLHFYPFNSSSFDLFDAHFHVVANGYLLLNGFDGSKLRNVEIREYILWVDSDYLEILFIPLKRTSFGFVNAIEVVSCPKDLILDVARFVDLNGGVKIDGMSKNGYETLFRVNVGGPKVTPFNDSLWRTWVSDDEFVGSIVGSKDVRFSGRIRYRDDGASREVLPDNVCNSGRVMSSSGLDVLGGNMSWVFPVLDGYKYLVRAHFCDIVSPALYSLYFNVYVNGILAYENLDLSSITNSLASPFYADFVIDGIKDEVLTVSVGPSNWSSTSGVEAILNGLEVFKLSNSMESFDGLVSSASIMRKCRRRNSGLLTLLVAAIGLLVAASVILRKRFMAIRHSVPWTRLPIDVSEVDLKSGYR